jgi:hypothetical protein
MPSGTRRVGSLLDSLPELKAISVQVSRIAAMQQAYVEVIPSALAGRSRVGWEEADVLVLIADSGAVGAKLRVLAPRVLAALQRLSPALQRIKVEVRASQRTMPVAERPRRIGTTGLGSLTALAQSLPDGPLHLAVAALVRRQGRLDGDDQPLEHEESQGERDHD